MNRHMLLLAGADVTAGRNPFRIQPRMAGSAIDVPSILSSARPSAIVAALPDGRVGNVK